MLTQIYKNILFVALLGSASVSIAQSTEYAWGIGAHPGMYSFYAVDRGFFKSNEYEPGIALSLYRYLNRSFDLGIDVGAGYVRHPELEADFLNGLRDLHRDAFYNGNLALRYKLDNGYILPQDFVVSPFLKAGIGGNSYMNLKNWNLFAPVGAGLQIRLHKSAAIILQTAYNFGISSPDYVQHSIGLNLNLGSRIPGYAKVPPAPDRDYDGVPDDRDACPDINGVASAAGCPDADGDGLADAEDRCPDVAGYANLFGCIDSDYDGVIDPEDPCPNQYATTSTGCPEAKPADRDNDGISDMMDECPDEAGFFTAKGCPDADGDGVTDAQDKCPDQYGEAQYQGCHIPYEEILARRMGKARGKRANEGDGKNVSFEDIDPSLPDEEYCERVSMSNFGNAYFEYNKARPQQTAYTSLAKMLDVMKRCVKYNFEVEGHTDSDGSETYNQALSQNRADAVRTYFVEKGIDPQRIKSRAFGESKPVAPNTTNDGKQQNRRVEFKMNRGF
jgi:outer membrane protein OmpA-like peptidoglycan-associated protein